jgi:hypothetical protein
MSKGKRRSNKHRKEFRAACWEHARTRKTARRDAQTAAEVRNRANPAGSPWQQAKAKRAAARAAA